MICKDSELWHIICQYLDKYDVTKLIKLKIIPKKFICKLCSSSKYIMFQPNNTIITYNEFFCTSLDQFKLVSKECGVHLGYNCSNCGYKYKKDVFGEIINFGMSKEEVKNWNKKFKKKKN